jgi:hypothetical protein
MNPDGAEEMPLHLQWFGWKVVIFKQKILLAFILVCTAACSASRDVASVSFRGDCTSFGMKIVSVYFDDGAFLIVTTRARFEYAAGELKIYQGLGSDVDRRLVATMTIRDVNEFEKVESNDDHALFWSEKVNIGIYGDSKYQTLYPANLWSI